jgi:hypothetical protein
LEIARRQRDDALTAQGKAAVERWHDPAALEFLKGSPVNCLVIPWAAGLAEDAAQQKSAAALLAAARQRKLAVIGWVEGAGGHDAALAAAKSAGLTAVAIQDFRGQPDPLVIPWGDRSKAPWEASAPVWPGVQAASGGTTTAGPTSVPWLDSNGWFIQLARARVAMPVWVLFNPPRGSVVRPQSYPMAVSDAEAAGGRWVISLDDGLRAGLADGNAASKLAWDGITSAVGFFEKHAAWRSYRSLGVTGVVSDFAGENFDFSGELLNLMARRGLLFRVIWKSRVSADSFAGLKALVYADGAQPPQDLRDRMLAFVEQGGLLVAGSKWGPEGKPGGTGAHGRFEVRALGKGRLAVAQQELGDPYQLVADTQSLVSYENDLVRLFNPSSSGSCQFTGSPDGKQALLQLLTYAGARGTPSLMTVWTRRKFRSARLWSIDGGEPAILKQAAAEDGGMEFYLPPLAAAYVAVEFEA